MFDKVYRHGERGSGRTWRQLERLPDGSAFVVLNSAHAEHCRRILWEQARDPTAIRFLSAERALQVLARPPRLKVAADHQVLECMPAEWQQRWRATAPYHDVAPDPFDEGSPEQ